MNDFLGRPLELGDSVIIIAPRYRSLVLARIIGFTPRNVRVCYMNTWNYGKDGLYEELLQSPGQLVKVDGPDLTHYLLKKD
jgi:hypothetical protein